MLRESALFSHGARVAVAGAAALAVFVSCSREGGHGQVTEPGPSEILGPKLDLQPTLAQLSPGDTLRLRVNLWDDRGNAVSDPTVDWKSSNPAVAKIAADGVVMALDSGVVRVTATAGIVSASAEVRVLPAPGTRGRR